ncbi:MAG TPA: nuclear transport factor 2 family protein [Acidimicrobiia bacterium]|nr:nuclear transport factor 2 family protein [Acidimicrobiia bacterium]
MSLMDALARYFSGWNDHEPAAVVAALAEGGTFEDPTAPDPRSGNTLAQYVSELITGFPDVHFDLTSVAATSETTAAVQWVMHGTNTGPGPGGPATGRSIAISGADFIEYDPVADRLSKVVGYFDTAALLRQLGRQSHISPADVPGRVAFGLASRVTTGEAVEPGCFTITSIDVRDRSVEQVDDFANRIVEGIAEQPGYLGSIFATVGRRKYTFTAWRDTDAVQSLQTTVHRDAMRRFASGNLGTRVMASVWIPLRSNVRASTRPGERPVRQQPLAEPWL